MQLKSIYKTNILRMVSRTISHRMTVKNQDYFSNRKYRLVANELRGYRPDASVYYRSILSSMNCIPNSSILHRKRSLSAKAKARSAVHCR